MSDVYLRSKFAVQGPEVGSFDRDRPGARVGKSFRERLIEVIAHFAFELDLFIKLEARPSGDSRQIRARLIQPQIIRKHAYLHVFIVLSLRQWNDTPHQQK